MHLHNNFLDGHNIYLATLADVRAIIDVRMGRRTNRERSYAHRYNSDIYVTSMVAEDLSTPSNLKALVCISSQSFSSAEKIKFEPGDICFFHGDVVHCGPPPINTEISFFICNA